MKNFWNAVIFSGPLTTPSPVSVDIEKPVRIQDVIVSGTTRSSSSVLPVSSVVTVCQSQVSGNFFRVLISIGEPEFGPPYEKFKFIYLCLMSFFFL